MQAGIYSANHFVDGLLERACPDGLRKLSAEYLQSLLIVLGVEIASTSPLPLQLPLPVSEIATRSGYSNISAYIEAFKGRFGVTPGQFQANLRYQDGAMSCLNLTP